MKKTIVSIIIGILVLAGLIWLARPGTDTSASTPSNGTLAIEEPNNYAFGAISMAAGKVTHQFKVRNTGSEAVTVGKMYTSCMCTTATLITSDDRLGPVGMPGHGIVPNLNKVIQPNEEVTVEVVFDPAAHGPAGVGKIARKVVVENNTGTPLELGFTATVTP